jgi:hypothetical protein
VQGALRGQASGNVTTSAISQTSEARSPQPKGDPAAAPSSPPHDRPPDFFPGEEPQGFIESRTSLLSARGHSMLLNYDRARFISTRLSAVALFLAIATIAWVPVDVVLLDQHWTIIAPLMAGRLVTGLLFLAVASLQFRTAGLREELFLLGLVICIGVGFLLYSHYTLAVTAGGAFNTDRAHTAYSLFPSPSPLGLRSFPLRWRRSPRSCWFRCLRSSVMRSSVMRFSIAPSRSSPGTGRSCSFWARSW